jgi:hypothetical protein
MRFLTILLSACFPALLSCASPIQVTQSPTGCTVTAELRTGERISCAPEGVLVERASISETVRASGGMLGGALRVLLGGAAP